MKLSKLLFPLHVILALLSFACVLFFYAAWATQLPPYQMSTDAVRIRVQGMLAFDEASRTILARLRDLVAEHPVTIVLEDIDQMGLGVYDPQQVYAFDLDTADGRALFDSGSGIYLRADSYYASAETLPAMSGELLTVVGRYRTDSPLYHPRYEYVYPLFSGTSLHGEFYLDNASDELVDAFIREIERGDGVSYGSGNFSISVSRYGSPQLMSTLSHPTSVGCLIGMALILVNLLLCYREFNRRHAKAMRIHAQYGGQSWPFIRQLLPAFLRDITASFAVASALFALCGQSAFGHRLPLLGFALALAGYTLALSVLYVLSLFQIASRAMVG